MFGKKGIDEDRKCDFHGASQSISALCHLLMHERSSVRDEDMCKQSEQNCACYDGRVANNILGQHRNRNQADEVRVTPIWN